MSQVPIAAVAVLGCILMSQQARAQSSPPTIGVIGSSVDMYADANCPTLVCRASFPLNSTGRVIKVTYISCRVIVSGGNLTFVSAGPAATSLGDGIKTTFFSPWTSVTEGSGQITYMSASPNMFLGAGRYLTIYTAASSTASNIQVKCQASGVFAQ